MVGPAAKRAAVAYACEGHGLSERRACQVIEADRSSVRYRSLRPDDPVLRRRIRELACERRRFGYRRLQILIEREGIRMNHKKFRRLYREEKLQVKRRGGRKRALGTRRPMVLPLAPNQRWAMMASSSRATLMPDKEVSGSSTRHSREKSSTTARMRKRRPSVKASETKSSDQR